jgi:transcriptional regulator with XRE-family HTH domain
MKEEKQEQAILLRKQGRSVKQIEKELGVSRSSVSRWVKNIQLDDSQKAALLENSRKNALNSAEKSKQQAEERRLLLKKSGSERVMLDRDFAVICALYWGEGGKTNSDVRLCNSDPKMVKLFVDWIKRSGHEISACVSYYAENGIHYDDIENWWIENVRSICHKDFRKPVLCSLNRASQRKNVGKLPYGTIIVRVAKSTSLFWEIMGGIEGLQLSV